MRKFIHRICTHPDVNLDPKKFSTHSCRRGAAHNAAMAGVGDCAIRVQGRWRTDCYTRYTSLDAVEAARLIATRAATVH